MTERSCFWHGDEPQREDHTTICYECGHAFTADELVTEDLLLRVELWVTYYPSGPVPQPRRPEEIFSCPLCAHDL